MPEDDDAQVEWFEALTPDQLDAMFAGEVAGWERVRIARRTEPEHQPREHPVPCAACRTVFTWEYDAICVRCKLESKGLIP